MGMTVLLIQPNVGMKDTGIQINHGLAVLAAALKENDFEVKLRIVDDLSYRKKIYLDDLRIKSLGLIAVTAYSNQWDCVKEIALSFKKIIGVPVICGGPHVTLFPEAIAQTDAIDAVIVGEGEIVFGRIADCIQKEAQWRQIPGVWTRNPDGTVSKNGVAPRVGNLDGLSFPDYEIYAREILLNYPGIIFSRGCPYDCSYCCNHAYRRMYQGDEFGVRFMSPGGAVAFAKYYKSTFSPSHLDIDDDTFTKNPRWLKEFLGGFKKEVGLPFNCNARPETINSEVVRWLRQSGCHTISVGVESGHEPLRQQLLKRRMTNQDIIKAAEIIHKEGLKLSTFNMVGLPGETWNKFRETVKLNQRIAPDRVQLAVYYPFRGTELGDYCYANNLVKRGAAAGSYFGKSILRIPGFSRWRVILGYRLFKFWVYRKRSLWRALWELAKDSIKMFWFSDVLIGPYLRVKRYVMRREERLR